MSGICPALIASRASFALLGAVMAVGDIKRRDIRKSPRPRRGFRDPPNLLLYAVRALKAVDRLALNGRRDQVANIVGIAKRQKDQSRLRLDGQQMAGAVLDLVGPHIFVFLITPASYSSSEQQPTTPVCV